MTLPTARKSLSRFPAAMSLLLTVPNDDSGILSVIPSALFISKAVRATGSAAITALKGLAGFTLGFNVIANCSNTTAYAVIFPVSVRVFGKAPSRISSLHVYAISDVSRWFCIELDASSQR